MLTKLKDTDKIILSMLDDRDLLSACLADKNTNSLCDETFFRNRIYEKYPNLVPFKTSDISWKNYYLKIVYYIDKLEIEHGFKFTKDSKGTPKQYYEIIENKPIKRKLMLKLDSIIKNKFYDLLDYYISRGFSRSSYYYLAKYGEIDYFDKLLKKYNNVTKIMFILPDPVKAAVLHRQLSMLDFLISKGISAEYILGMAATLDRPEVEKYIRETYL